jgi:hypothetical protein
MSILEDIEKRCNEQPPTLILYEPFDEVPRKRKIYVEADLHKFIVGPWLSERDYQLSMDMQLDLDRFVSGAAITVALQASAKTKVADANLKRLYRKTEVWEFRIRGSNPQQRVFGRFAEWNRFIALFRNDRPGIDYDVESLRVYSEWVRLFSRTPFKEGKKANDYVSGPVVSR